jgi:methyl-accepting chemotaxis protein
MPAQEETNKKKSFKSLSVVLTTAFLSLSLGIILFTNLVQLLLNFQTQQNAVLSDQEKIAHNAADQVRNFIQEKIDVLNATTKTNDLISLSKKDQNIILEKVLSYSPAFRQVALFDKNIKQLNSVSRLSDISQASLVEQFNNKVVSEKEKRSLWISNVYVDKTTSEPIITLALPISNVFGDFQGNLTAEINLKFMWDLVSGIKVGNNGYIFVVDKKGQLLAFKDISRVLKGENVSNLQTIREFIQNGTETDFNSSAGIAKGITNASVVSAFVPLSVPNWAIVAEVPVMEAYQKVIQGLIVSSLIIFLAIIVTVVISLLLARSITMPIRKLRDGAEQIRKGNLKTVIEVNSSDEIGELASVFNQMTMDLQELYVGLEQKVKERTEKLDQKIAELEKFQKLTVGRELKMIELKKELDGLKGKGK